MTSIDLTAARPSSPAARGGLGEGMAQALAAAGARVMIGDRREAEARPRPRSVRDTASSSSM